jgi:hypothetical protein
MSKSTDRQLTDRAAFTNRGSRLEPRPAPRPLATVPRFSWKGNAAGLPLNIAIVAILILILAWFL